MSDDLKSPAPDVTQPKRGLRFRRTAWIVALVVAARLAGAAVTSAFSHGPGFGPVHWHGGMMGRSFDPAKAEDRPIGWSGTWPSTWKPPTRNRTSSARWSKRRFKDIVPMREKMQSARLKGARTAHATDDRSRRDRAFSGRTARSCRHLQQACLAAIGDAAEILTPTSAASSVIICLPQAGPGATESVIEYRCDRPHPADEDDPRLAEMVKNYLGEAGFSVTVSSLGMAALHWKRARHSMRWFSISCCRTWTDWRSADKSGRARKLPF